MNLSLTYVPPPLHSSFSTAVWWLPRGISLLFPGAGSLWLNFPFPFLGLLAWCAVSSWNFSEGVCEKQPLLSLILALSEGILTSLSHLIGSLAKPNSRLESISYAGFWRQCSSAFSLPHAALEWCSAIPNPNPLYVTVFPPGIFIYLHCSPCA